MSSNCCECLSKPTAEVMLDDEEFIQEYTNQLDEERDRLLSNLNQILCHKLYKIREQEIGAHESIVLSTENKHFVTVSSATKPRKPMNRRLFWENFLMLSQFWATVIYRKKHCTYKLAQNYREINLNNYLRQQTYFLQQLRIIRRSKFMFVPRIEEGHFSFIHIV